QIVAFKPGAGISNQSKAGGVRLRKTVKCKRADREDNLFLRLPENSVSRQALSQFHFDQFHASLRTFETKRAAQFFSLASGKAGADHGHPQELLLKQRYSKGAF